jgi:hypothetical protein
MAIRYHRQTDYAARPRAPRRRGHQPAVAADQPGQTNLFEVDRAKTRTRAMRHPCPACRASPGSPCTRPPRIGEGSTPVPLGYLCHPQRLGLDDEHQADDEDATP